MKFRKLKPDEIEVRVATINKKRCSLLLYKDARVDMRLLDETVGPLNWKREHQVINDNLFCTVSIYNEVIGEWVSKQDVGIESYTQKEKGQASDAFKRACFNWGIGRELYTAPFIWVNLNANELSERNGKYQLDYSVKLRVNKIDYDSEGNISYLEIFDNNNNCRFKHGKQLFANEDEEKKENLQHTLVAIAKKKNLTKEMPTLIKEMFGKESSNDLTVKELSKLMIKVQEL